MADPGIFGTLYGGFQYINQALMQADPTGTIKTIENLLMPTSYGFNYDVFPEDLGSEQMNHYMIMKFFTPEGMAQAPYGSLSSTGFTNNVYNVALFMPSEAGGGIFPNFSDTHEYPDISMSNILLNQIAASGKIAKVGVDAVRAGAALTGRAINPGVQVLYKTTHLRTFEFAFLMAPRSEKESQSMENIIKSIRKYAAPEDQGWFYRSPAEVEIEFHWAGKLNPHIIKMRRQVITYIDVNFAPQGVYSTFTNGYPVSCMFAIKTREMEIIDRAKVEQGY